MGSVQSLDIKSRRSTTSMDLSGRMPSAVFDDAVGATTEGSAWLRDQIADRSSASEVAGCPAGLEKWS